MYSIIGKEKIVRFDSLTYGDFFLYDGSLYMKIDTDYEDCYFINKNESPNEKTVIKKFNVICFGEEMLFFETMENRLVESVDVDIVIK